MKTIILAGGLGTRFSEETAVKPKPMIEIGGKPMLWHIMNIYAAQGFTEFIIALGYKAEAVKQYFLNFQAINSDLTIDLANGDTILHDQKALRWKVHLVDTGPGTQTGGRLARLRAWLREDATFMMTYGDGLADIDVRALIAFHRSHGKLATVTAVRPSARFGGLILDGSTVLRFAEKAQAAEGWINGGFFVLERQVLDYVGGDHVAWEREPLERLAESGQLRAYLHEGFWHPMDTPRDQRLLEEQWASGRAPWRTWA